MIENYPVNPGNEKISSWLRGSDYRMIYELEGWLGGREVSTMVWFANKFFGHNVFCFLTTRNANFLSPGNIHRGDRRRRHQQKGWWTVLVCKSEMRRLWNFWKNINVMIYPWFIHDTKFTLKNIRGQSRAHSHYFSPPANPKG